VCLENLKALSITPVFCSENDLKVLSTPSGFLYGNFGALHFDCPMKNPFQLTDGRGFSELFIA